jgi:hypothetical protein
MIRKIFDAFLGVTLLLLAVAAGPVFAQDKGIGPNLGTYTVERNGEIEVRWPGYGYVTFGDPNLNGFAYLCRMSDVVPFEYMADTLGSLNNRSGRARMVFDDCYAGLPESVWHGRLCLDIPPYQELEFMYDLCTYVSEDRAAWRRDDSPRR